MRSCSMETLEPRQLLAADFVVDASTEATEGFNLRLTSDGAAIQLIDALDGTIGGGDTLAFHYRLGSRPALVCEVV